MFWLGILAFLLVAVVIWWGLIGLGKLLDHLEAKVNNSTNTTAVVRVEDILSEELEKKVEGKQKVSLDKLRKKVGNKGMMTCHIDGNNKVDTTSIEWLGADQREQGVEELLDENEGLLLLEH